MYNRILVLFIAFLGCKCQFSPNDKPEPEEPLRLLWGYSYDYVGFGPRMAPMLLGDSLVIISGDRNLTSLRGNSGEVKWKAQVSEVASSSVYSLLFDGVKIYGWQDKIGVLSWEINSGQETWRYETGDRIKLFHSIDNERYYVGASNDTGSWYWSFGKNGNLIYTQSTDHAPWLTIYYDNKIYSGQGWWDEASKFRGQIDCFMSEDGSHKWTYYTEDGGFVLVPPIVQDGGLFTGTIYGSPNSVVVALNAETGEEICSNNLRCYALILVDDVLYGSTSLEIYALDKETGSILWITDLKVGNDENHNIAYMHGYLYRAHNGYLFILDASSGKIVNKFVTPDDYPILQVSTGAGKVFVQSGQHLYAYTPYDPGEDGD